jgi:hypothetical protein
MLTLTDNCLSALLAMSRVCGPIACTHGACMHGVGCGFCIRPQQLYMFLLIRWISSGGKATRVGAVIPVLHGVSLATADSYYPSLYVL